MCVEQCTFQMSSVAFIGHQNARKLLAAGALPQTHWEAYSAPQTEFKAEFKGPTSGATTSNWRGGKEREGEGALK